MDAEYVCLCRWDDLGQALVDCCPECTKRGASEKTPWDYTCPILPTPTLQAYDPRGDVNNNINRRGSGSDDEGRLQQVRYAQHESFSPAPRARAAEAEHPQTIIHPAVQKKQLNSQDVVPINKRRSLDPSWLYRRAVLWTQIPRDATHSRGCALVCAGLIPIIGAFFYECKITYIPVNGEAKTQIGWKLASDHRLKKYRAEMVDDKRYKVRVSRFGQPMDPRRARITSREFDYISVPEMPSMATAVRHLLLYLGSGRDRESSYRVYHETTTTSGGHDALREHQSLFGMVRFPWAPEPHTATTARMINITPGKTFPAPTLNRRSDSWRNFCNCRLKDTWEDIRMQDFRYETYKVDEQRQFRPQGLPPSHIPPGSPPAPSPRPSVPPAETEVQNQVSSNTTGLTHQGAAHTSRDRAIYSTSVFQPRAMPEGMNRSAGPDPSAADLTTPEGTDQGTLGTMNPSPQKSALGCRKQSTVPEGERQNGH